MKCQKANINESHIQEMYRVSSLEIVIHQLSTCQVNLEDLGSVLDMIFYEGTGEQGNI